MAAFDSNPSSAPTRTSAVPFVVMTVVTVASVAIAAGLILTASDSEAAGQDADAPVLASPLPELSAPGLNDDAKMLRLDYAHRHAQLRRAGTAAFDATLHAALDVVQADQSPTPCATFAAGLAVLEQGHAAEYDWALTMAAVPQPGATESTTDCEALGARLQALRTSTAPGEDATAPTDDPPDPPVEPARAPEDEPIARPEPESVADAKPTKKSSKPGKAGKSKPKDPFKDADLDAPWGKKPAPAKSDDPHIGHKLDEELKPMGGG